MTFADLQRGDTVFLDPNTFIYYSAPDPTFPVRFAGLELHKQRL